ncbi:MAG: MBG domain-containing protein, partial [Prosthecobacter sp.]
MNASSLFSPHRWKHLLAVMVALVCFSTDASAQAPNAPTNLRGVVVTSTSFAVIWDDNSANETNFDLLYSPNGGAFQVLALGSSAGTGTLSAGTYDITGTGWNTLALQIRATNASGSTLSNTVNLTFNTAFNAPNSPLTKVSADGQVLVMWTDNSSSESGFSVEIATNASGPFSVWGSGTGTGLIGALPPSSTFYFRIRAYQGTAQSPTATTAYTSVVSAATPALATPTSLAATASSESTVNLSWVDNSAVEEGYAVYVKTSAASSYTLYDYAASNATSYSVTGLSPGTTYNFQLAAAYEISQGNIVESARSNTATATTRDGFTSLPYAPITFNQPFSYQAAVTTVSARSSWNITGLPTGLVFNSTSGVLSGTPTVTGVFNCPMTATFANGWTTNSTLTLRIIRGPGAPVAGVTFSPQTLTAGGNTTIGLSDKFSDPDAESAVRVVTNLGTMDFILYNTATPQTVANFLGYVNAGSNNFNGAVIHRSEPGFVIQGGSFKVQSAPNNFTKTPTTASPVNEPGISNLRGTVAMAKLPGDPNSATTDFFVSLADNSSNLDNQNGGFTVFARVAGNGMTVADGIAALPRVSQTVNINGTANTSLTNWPVTSGSTMDTTKMVTMTSVAPVPVLSYSITGNSNPAAVTASISGNNLVINGVAGGQSNITVTATDLDGGTVSQVVPVTVNQAPAITSGTPTSTGTVGVAYSFTCTASGFPVPAFAVASGSLPTGLTLSSTGVVSGSPTAAGTFTGSITATNTSGTSSAQNFSITIAKATATVTLGSLAQTYNGSARTVTATTSPAGLNVTFTYDSSATAPTNAGSYAVVATVNDANYQGTQ